MLGQIRRFFEEHIVDAVEVGRGADREHAYRLATAALLIEMSRADFEVTAAERTAVSSGVRRVFELSEDETRELIALAEERADEATSLYEFTRLVNAYFNDEQKRRVVELLWHVAYADGELDKHEEYLVRKVADLIYVPHAAFIRAKLEVRARLRGTDEA